jgi:neopullulanase
MPLIDRPAWVRDAVFYQIFPDRFARSSRVEKPLNLEPWDVPPTAHGYKGGDLLGVVDRLDWLTDRGFNAIYLNPIFQSASNHRYHTHDYLKVDPLLGGDAAFDELLAACRERGVRVVIDGVFNHASRGFFQFNDVLENGEQSPYTGWFHIHEFPLNPYAHTQPANYEAWWGLRALPKFNTDNPETREFLMRVGEHWARRGIDGWRLDVPEEIETAGFWEEFRTRVRAVNPDLYLVGEIWHEAAAWIGDGSRFDAVMNYPFAAATIAYAVGGRLDHSLRLDNPAYTVAPAIDGAGYRDRIEHLLAAYPPDAALANLNLLDSHDTARILSLASGDVASVVLSLVLLMTFPGAPCVYYGTEIGLEGGKDPDSRRSFPWDAEATWNRELLQTVDELVALRNDHPALRSSDYRVLWPAGPGDGTMAYACERTGEGERIVVIVNAGDDRETHSVPMDRASTRAALLWGHSDVEVGENQLRISMAPRSAAIWAM